MKKISVTKMHIRTGDEVIVLSGKDRGKTGRVLAVDLDRRMAIVDGIARVTKHKKPGRNNEPGGVVVKESYIYACKIMNVCKNCGRPARVGRRILENGRHVRFCKKCDGII